MIRHDSCTHTQLALASLIPNFSTTLTAQAGEGRLVSPFAFLPVLALFPVEERGFLFALHFYEDSNETPAEKIPARADADDGG